MSLISNFIDKCLSVLRLGKNWFSKLISSIVEAGRTISYVETVNPSQADTLHIAIKQSDIQIFEKEFEKAVRKAITSMRFGKVKIAIDITEEPYWGKHGFQNTRAKVYEKSDESWQYINLAIVDPNFIPLMSLPYKQTDDLDELVIDLLEYLRTLPLKVGLILFDRGFYHAYLIDYLENYKGGLPYIILARKTEAVKGYMNITKRFGRFKHKMPYSKDKSKWEPYTTIVICKSVGKDKNGNPIDWSFATNQQGTLRLVWIYKKRWNIETGFRIQDEAKIKSKSSNPLIRYFYYLMSMLLILMWRLHNYCNPYMVFKRFLKHVELTFSLMIEEPPPLRALI